MGLAHISDLHTTPLETDSFRDLCNKRFLGWLSWNRKRQYRHRLEVLECLLDGEIPVAGVASTSYVDSGDEGGRNKRAKYHLSGIDRRGGAGFTFEIDTAVRAYDGQAGEFVEEEQRSL